MRSAEQLVDTQFNASEHSVLSASMGEFAQNSSAKMAEYQDLKQPPNPEVYARLAWDVLDQRTQVPVVLSMLLDSLKIIKQDKGFGAICEIPCWCGPSYENRPKLLTESINTAFHQARQNLFDADLLEPTLQALATRSVPPALVSQIVGQIQGIVRTISQRTDESAAWYVLDWEYSAPSEDGEMMITFSLLPLAMHAMLASDEAGEHRLPVAA